MSRFLLAFLSIEAILQEPTIYRRRQKLRAMNNGLDLGGAYEAMLGRIKAQGGEKARLGMAVLMWISHSQRPLQVDEICHAIAIRIGSNDLDKGDIPTISTLLDCCQGLVTVDMGASTVRLIHFTLQEHLRIHPDLFDLAHSTIAETCLTYLNFQHVKNLPAGPSPDPRETPFLKYSSLYWGTHMRIKHSDRAVTLALQLLDQFDSHITATSLWKSINNGLPFGYYSGHKPFSTLHCISYFGIPEVIIPLLKMNRWDVNQRDSLGMTPLIWAAVYGHEEVVRLLLQKRFIQPDHQDANYGRTALSWAAGNGHEGVVRLFLRQQFVNPGSVDGQGGKLARVASLLFERYVNPDNLCRRGRTPLSWAAENGHEGIVKLLLERKAVNPNTRDTMGGLTPLSWAAECGHDSTVKLLLERKDINPNSSSESGRTPLSRAARSGHEGVVKLLLEREDIHPDTADTDYGQTPLSLAAENGNDAIVKLLLERKDVNPDSLGKIDRTPLSWAAQNGHEGVVKLLLGRKDVNPNSSDKLGETPLTLAIIYRQQRVAELLQARHP